MEAQTPGPEQMGFELDPVRRPEDVAEIAASLLGPLDHECVLVVACDAVGRVLATVTVAEGAAGWCRVPVREVMRAVLLSGGVAFAIAHNHPSGRPEPSCEDFAATRAVADAARVVGLRFLGHVVVADAVWTSIDRWE